MNLKLLIFLLIILSFRFYFFNSSQFQLADGEQISFETTLLSQPQLVGSQQIFTANSSTSLRIKIVTSRFPEINYGDFVRISGYVRVSTPNVPGKISIKNDRVLMYFPKIEIADNPANILQAGLKSVNTLQQKLITLFSQTLPAPSSSLLLGIIFGIKEQMPKEFAGNLKISGVFHVIAASGMNVTLVGGFFSTLFAFFLKRQIAIALSILGIMFYAVLAGLEPSIIRASIMGILVFSAQIMGRQTLAVNGLFLAGFAMLFLDPTLLLDIGFQLSFMATLGLILVPKIRAIGRIGVVGGSINTTIAAQIATLPILLANFGTYSIYSILINGLILWSVPMLMAVGGIGAIAGLIFMPLGQLIIYFCYPLLLYFITIVNFFGKIGGVLIVNNFPWQFSVGYYCLLVSGLIIFRKK
ncbi:MAG: ComEC/Rec2 family competence protein [Candidatus Levybacteria bacterium]|nr:ComEC/Rec2 family competence protein [Candidatus Levybacteria bacterium]